MVPISSQIEAFNYLFYASFLWILWMTNEILSHLYIRSQLLHCFSRDILGHASVFSFLFCDSHADAYSCCFTPLSSGNALMTLSYFNLVMFSKWNGHLKENRLETASFFFFFGLTYAKIWLPFITKKGQISKELFLSICWKSYCQFLMVSYASTNPICCFQYGLGGFLEDILLLT